MPLTPSSPLPPSPPPPHPLTPAVPALLPARPLAPLTLLPHSPPPLPLSPLQFLLVFQLVVGGVMAGKPYNFVKLMHSPSAALQAKIHRGGALILVAGIDEAIVLLLLTFRYLFGHKFGHYDPYAGEEGRARADNNLNA